MIQVKIMEIHSSNMSADFVRESVVRLNQPPIPSLGVWKEEFRRVVGLPSENRLADPKDQTNNHA